MITDIDSHFPNISSLHDREAADKSKERRRRGETELFLGVKEVVCFCVDLSARPQKGKIWPIRSYVASCKSCKFRGCGWLGVRSASQDLGGTMEDADGFILS